MLKLQTRIFASSYQFYIHDADYEHYDDQRLSWSDGEKLKYGYLATENAIYVLTKSDLNDHCVRIYVGKTPETNQYESVFDHKLEIISGRLLISSPSGEEIDDSIELANGIYRVKVCGKNIGKDIFSYSEEFDEEMDDDEYCNLNKFEAYDLFIEIA
jgi:hypothetical protein